MILCPMVYTSTGRTRETMMHLVCSPGKVNQRAGKESNVLGEYLTLLHRVESKVGRFYCKIFIGVVGEKSRNLRPFMVICAI